MELIQTKMTRCCDAPPILVHEQLGGQHYICSDCTRTNPPLWETAGSNLSEPDGRD